ncbi:MAG TPA: hypothetical protein VK989_12335 [Polyangia bacterium]|jgi:hypothetical protein|nr:hypothetical protein [Polyangia bacterium]
MDQAPPFEPHPISPELVAIIQTMLEKFAVRAVSRVAIESIPLLTVYSRCPCGCASVDFVSPRPKLSQSAIVSDAVATMRGGERVGLIVWASPDAVLSFEIYECDFYLLGTLPDPGTIQSFFPTD